MSRSGVVLRLVALEDAFARVRRALEEAGLAAGALECSLEEAGKGTEVYVSGREARYYTRAGFSTAYATSEALDGLVHQIMHGRLPDVRRLSLANRARIASAALNGWNRHRAQAPGTPPVWYQELVSGAWVTVRIGEAS